MRITITICTHNRVDMLRDTLTSLFAMHFDETWSFDVLVIDNRSSDGTKELVRRFSEEHPDLVKYHYEERIGLVFARNTAVQLASGEIVAFVDDDIFFDPCWLTAVRCLFEHHPTADCMAGRIVPQFEGGRPPWLRSDPGWLNIEGMYGATHFGDTDRLLTYPEHPVGANMAFRKAVFEKVGLFDPALGRTGANLLSKEESEFFERIARAGLKTAYSSKASVIHRIPSERTSKRWILRRFYWQGISQIVFESLTSTQTRASLLSGVGSDLAGIKRVMLGASLAPRALYWQLKGLRFWHAAFLAYTAGTLKQRLKHLSRRTPKP
jgi:glycosyltransferase involved in cell wall biosynthesis